MIQDTSNMHDTYREERHRDALSNCRRSQEAEGGKRRKKWETDQGGRALEAIASVRQHFIINVTMEFKFPTAAWRQKPRTRTRDTIVDAFLSLWYV